VLVETMSSTVYEIASSVVSVLLLLTTCTPLSASNRDELVRDILFVCPRHIVEDVKELIQLKSLIYRFIVQYRRFRLRIVRRCFDGVLRMIIPRTVLV